MMDAPVHYYYPRKEATEYAGRLACASLETSLGRACIAVLGQVVSVLALSVSDADFQASLKARWPKANCDWSTWDDVPAQLLERVLQGEPVALGLYGTAFQHSVWAALLTIPPGCVVSYKELAQKMSRPGAVRAVANAVAMNQVAVAVPCHRVIRSDGSLGGYRWGRVCKQALLDKEGVAI